MSTATKPHTLLSLRGINKTYFGAQPLHVLKGIDLDIEEGEFVSIMGASGFSFVAQMRGYADPKAGGIFWFGVDDAATSVYVPIYSRINHVPECFAEGNGDMYTFSHTSAWWIFNLVANWAYTKYSRMFPEIKAVQTAIEAHFNAQIAAVDAEVATLPSDKEVRHYLTNFCDTQADNAMTEW